MGSTMGESTENCGSGYFKIPLIRAENGLYMYFLKKKKI
jgi:hypothetical protein